MLRIKISFAQYFLTLEFLGITLRSMRFETPTEKSLLCKSILFLFHCPFDLVSICFISTEEMSSSSAGSTAVQCSEVPLFEFYLPLQVFSMKISYFLIHKIANCTISLIFANLGTTLLKILSFRGQPEYQQNCVTFCGRFWGLAENFCIIRSYDSNV